MKNYISNLSVIIISLFFVSISCVEEIDFVEPNQTFESALVIDATITNESKQQIIYLSRTYAFEEDGPNPESGATVKIESDQGVYIFTETDSGTYISDITFAAQNNVNYQLIINTNDNKTYSSNTLQLTQSTEIDNLYAARETNDYGVNGMAIYLDSYDPTNNSKFYRYTYEETYKIIAPYWNSEEIELVDALTCEVNLRDRIQEERVCYNTIPSTNINLESTNGLTEDRVDRHLVRFIDSNDFILSWRYSIKVRQYIQSLEAYNYYNTLKGFSGEGSLFSQTQPGFINGNILSEDYPDEKVIGFFDVSTVSEKRMFFNFDDFYDGEPLPDYVSFCYVLPLDQYTISGNCGGLISSLIADNSAYIEGASKVGSLTVGPFYMVLRACGDCTALGTNIVPEFWEE
jgi:hypothetical protein